MNLITLAQEYADEDKARGLLESLLWPDGAVCPHCKNHKEKPIYKLVPKAESKSPARKGVHKCGACRKQFTVTVGTIFEDSHLPISKWLMAIIHSLFFQEINQRKPDEPDAQTSPIKRLGS